MPKQTEIPGMERPKIAAIESAAEKYVDLRDKRMKLLESEIAAKEKLVEAMQKSAEKLSQDGEGNLIYKYDEQVVILAEQVGVKVKHAATPAEEGE